MQLVISPDSDGTARADWGDGPVSVSIGRGNIGVKGGEGDGITPLGVHPIRHVYYRADRIEKPVTALPVSAIAPDDGWCDAPGDPNYNRPVTHPYPASAERLWRDDHLYDVIVVLGFNDDPVVPGRGSAIFLHLKRRDGGPTEGCVGFARADLLAILSRAAPGDAVRVVL